MSLLEPVLPSWQNDFLELPQYQSHRGWCLGGAKENSLESIEEAVARGAKMVEVDVHFTADGVAVLSHDASLMRLFGSNQIIHKSTVAELGDFKELCLLADALQAFPETKFNIELKKSIHSSKSCALALARVIQDSIAEERCLISSFQPALLRACSHALPKVPRGLLVAQESHLFVLTLLPLFIYSRAHLIHFEAALITPALIKTWRHRGVGVVAWTVNDRLQAHEFLSWGAQSIISDEIIC